MIRRRLSRDMIEVYKIMKVLENMNVKLFIKSCVVRAKEYLMELGLSLIN